MEDIGEIVLFLGADGAAIGEEDGGAAIDDLLELEEGGGLLVVIWLLGLSLLSLGLSFTSA